MYCRPPATSKTTKYNASPLLNHYPSAHRCPASNRQDGKLCGDKPSSMEKETPIPVCVADMGCGKNSFRPDQYSGKLRETARDCLIWIILLRPAAGHHAPSMRIP